MKKLTTKDVAGESTVRKDLPLNVRLGMRMWFTAIEVNTNGVVIAQDPNYIR
ncbi:MAG TPA: hypothetical protein VFC84_04135 [Desulfosporosinus sp.]|nr:hypothetical protein [Desulfosporosinus sp.]